jgi:hypothetical protein
MRKNPNPMPDFEKPPAPPNPPKKNKEIEIIKNCFFYDVLLKKFINKNVQHYGKI